MYKTAKNRRSSFVSLFKISYFTCFSHLILTLYTFYVSRIFVWFSLHHLECISVSLMYFYQFHVRWIFFIFVVKIRVRDKTNDQFCFAL